MPNQPYKHAAKSIANSFGGKPDEEDKEPGLYDRIKAFVSQPSEDKLRKSVTDAAKRTKSK